MGELDEQPSDLDLGIAGASARREHERRRTNREERMREKHPRIGGALLALSEEPLHQRVWGRGASGEEYVAASFAKRLNADVIVLHDRRVPGSRANIDHIAIAPSGVWVVDAKRYRGKVEVVRPLFGQAKLTIAGSDRTNLVHGLAKQVALVEAIMRDIAPQVPVRGALCFVDAELPLLGNLSFNGYPLLYPKRLAKRINERGSLQPDAVQHVARTVATRLSSA